MWAWPLPPSQWRRTAVRLLRIQPAGLADVGSLTVGRMRSYRVTTVREKGVTYKTVQSRGPVGLHFLGPYRTQAEKQASRRMVLGFFGAMVFALIVAFLLVLWLVAFLFWTIVTVIALPTRRLIQRDEQLGIERWSRAQVRGAGGGISRVARGFSTLFGG